MIDDHDLPKGDLERSESTQKPSLPARPRIVTSQELLQRQKELWIEHEGQIYRLRVTSRGKLLLTK